MWDIGGIDLKLEKFILEIMEMEDFEGIELVELDQCISEINTSVDSIKSSALEATPLI